MEVYNKSKNERNIFNNYKLGGVYMNEQHSFSRFLATLLIVGGIYIWFGTSPGMVVQAESINQPTPINQIFPDSALAEIMRYELGKQTVTDVVTQSELDSVTSVDGHLRNIASIEGVQYLSNVTKLEFYNNAITNIQPVANLTNLTYLDFGQTSIVDIQPVANLTNLTYLNLGGAEISDIQPLVNLTNLESLDLEDNHISDIQPVANLTNLTLLNLIDNELTDITPLSNLTNLRELLMGDDAIPDISPLANLTNLTKLQITSYNLSDVTPLSNLTNLNFLFLASHELRDIGPLSNLHDLESLIIRASPLSDITPLANLNSLTKLDLTSNMIEDISPLAGLTNLTQMDLSYNQIRDISAVSGLTNLDYLYMNENHISDISPMANLNNLIQAQIVYQQMTNEPIPFQTNISITNMIKDETGALIAPAPGYISDNGSYNSPNVTWDLPAYVSEVRYGFEHVINNGQIAFMGSVTQPLETVPDTYNVTFDVDGAQNSEEVVVDTLIGEPTAPTKEGYTFTGWFDAKTGGNKWDFTSDKMPANDITLYAQFSLNSYNAVFDVDGKTTSQTVDFQGLLTKPTDPTKEGYTFTGWYDAKTGGNKWDFASDKMPANDITLYAQFSKNGNNGTKTSSNGNGNAVKPNQPANEDGITITAPKNASNTDKSTTLPKTGDNGASLYVILGILLTGSALLTIKNHNI